MKFLYAAAAILRVASAAVDTTGLPYCSLRCLQISIQQAGCSALDYQCQCTTKKEFIKTSVTPCIIRSCSEADALTVEPATEAICQRALGASDAVSSAVGAVSSAVASVTQAVASVASQATEAASSTGAATQGKPIGAGVVVAGVAAMLL